VQGAKAETVEAPRVSAQRKLPPGAPVNDQDGLVSVPAGAGAVIDGAAGALCSTVKVMAGPEGVVLLLPTLSVARTRTV
jgi:hypothetical protein